MVLVSDGWGSVEPAAVELVQAATSDPRFENSQTRRGYFFVAMV